MPVTPRIRTGQGTHSTAVQPERTGREERRLLLPARADCLSRRSVAAVPGTIAQHAAQKPITVDKGKPASLRRSQRERHGRAADGGSLRTTGGGGSAP